MHNQKESAEKPAVLPARYLQYIGGPLTTPRAKIEAGWRYDAAETSASQLEALLIRHGLRVQHGSPLEQDVLNVLQFVSQKRAGAVDPVTQDIRQPYRTLVGVHEFARLLLTIQNDPQFPVLLPHLELLNQGQVLQNCPSVSSDQAANKLFELYLGGGGNSVWARS